MVIIYLSDKCILSYCPPHLIKGRTYLGVYTGQTGCLITFHLYQRSLLLYL